MTGSVPARSASSSPDGTPTPHVAPQRRVERGALWAFLPALAMLPFTVAVLALVWLPLGLVADVPFSWVLLSYAATGLLMFLRPFQVAVLTPTLGARAPTSAEAATIAPLWEQVSEATDEQRMVGRSRYVVRILPSDELNAFACGGHLVVVTTYAVEELTTDELRGVLAHEVSHHLGLHTVATTIVHWLSGPVVLFARIGFHLERVAQASAASFGRRNAAVDVASRIGAILMRAVGSVFSLGIRAADGLANLVGHDMEFEADRRAVSMGFGRELAAALRRVLAAGEPHRRSGWRARLAASHPPARTRVARIEALLRHPAR
ncbi:MAG: M48 family metalloprotease [Actinomycetota bacterium]